MILNNDYRPTVVVATGVMNAGGTETLIMETLRHATGRVRYILLIHYDNVIPTGVFDEEIKDLGIEIRYIPSVGSVGVRGYVKAFKQFADSIGKIDIIHSHINGVGGIIALAAKKAGVMHRICHCHADIHYPGNLINRTKNELMLSGMKLIIDRYATDRWACSTAAWNRLFMPWRERVVINNMIDTQKYAATEEKRDAAKKKFGLEGKVVVGAVGRVAPIKNYEVILKALVDTDACFVCFGRFDINNNYCRRLQDLATELGLSDRVYWMGNSNSVADDIHCIDLFVMPSFTEGFGMAAIEAQAASLPSLLSTGVPKSVDVGLGLVRYIDPNDVTGWNSEIRNISHHRIIPQNIILEKFSQAGFDSPDGVRMIEDKYIAISKK